ncbi:hypothetical protein GmHk_19G055319 [Glycine max]|nr:hypothetical protein GmHk_19G055319 [Glycine max]
MAGVMNFLTVEVVGYHSRETTNHIETSGELDQTEPGTKDKSFHFQEAWTTHPEFRDLVSQTWNMVLGDAPQKPEGIREKALVFNRETFGNIFRRKELEARIKGVHKILNVNVTSDMVQLEKTLQQEYNEVLAQEEILWFQKFKEN